MLIAALVIYSQPDAATAPELHDGLAAVHLLHHSLYFHDFHYGALHGCRRPSSGPRMVLCGALVWPGKRSGVARHEFVLFPRRALHGAVWFRRSDGTQPPACSVRALASFTPLAGHERARESGPPQPRSREPGIRNCSRFSYGGIRWASRRASSGPTSARLGCAPR